MPAASVPIAPHGGPQVNMNYNMRNTNSPMSHFLTKDGVAKWLSVPAEYVSELAKNGDLPSIAKHGRRWFRQDQIEAWFQDQKVDHTSRPEEKP